MATIHNISIRNFRGIKDFNQSFYGKKFICLIGRGDSGKSTILEAISYVLSSSWNLTFYDSDFYNCDTNNPIEIEATLTDLPDHFLHEKYGLHLRGIGEGGKIIDDFESGQGQSALTIKLEVKEDLEPKWSIINSRPNQEPITITAAARAKLSTYLISDFTDRHFSWSKGNPLYSLLKQEDIEDNDDKNIVINALRKAKQEIDKNPFNDLTGVVTKIIEKATDLGIDISGTTTTIDFKDISIKDNRVCLHDDVNVPFRLKGKGVKRLISIAIQMTLAENGGIILMDEIEQGLEPDRVQHIVSRLKKATSSQIFITTHSRDTVVELEASDFMIMKKRANKLLQVDASLQDCIRKNPEALFANRLIICEGATEVGICRAINEYRIAQGKINGAYNGVRFADGSGANSVKYCIGFHELQYPVTLFCDSDTPNTNSKKEELRTLGINIIDCEENNSIEKQIFKDLPWEGIKELISYQESKTSLESVIDSVGQRFSGTLQNDWKENDSDSLRKALGDTAKNNDWFKRIDHGEFLGSIICKYYDQMENIKLKTQLKQLSSQMGND